MLKPGISDGLQRICLKALEKNPADRYRDMSALIEDLGHVMRGELVRTRPSVYDNLLFHRAQRHSEEILEWNRRGLLSPEELDKLKAAYESLQRRGIPAVMEGRLYRFWQTLVYLGGWAVVNGALLWLIQQWEQLPRAGKLALGSVPAITAFALAFGMWKMERFRLTFVALVVGVLAVPLFTAVWLHEFEIAAHVPASRLEYELFHTEATSTAITNDQLLITALVAAAVAGGVMLWTSTTTHSAQAVLAVSFLYAAITLRFGLMVHLEKGEWATLGLKFLPLLLVSVIISKLLLDRPARTFQAPPWIYFASVLLLAICYAVSLYGLDEWTQIDETLRRPAAELMLSSLGVTQAAIGLLARDYLRHRCRSATVFIILFGLGNVLAGLVAAGEHWPPNWLHHLVFEKLVPTPHLALPVVSLGITLLACRFQLFPFLLVGLVGFAGSIHLLGYQYFEMISGWPKLLMIVGTVGFFSALFLELRRTRGNTIDDFVGQSRL
jgi:hypothetical protein